MTRAESGEYLKLDNVTITGTYNYDIANEIVPNVEDWEFIKELNLLNANPEILYRNFKLLSSGEQVKILLARLMPKQLKLFFENHLYKT